LKSPLAFALSLLLTLSTVVLFSHTPTLQAQTAAQTTVPRLVHFSGTATDLNGNPLNGVVGITFLLYAEQTGGAPLWLETQNVQAGANGHYSVLLGSTIPEGLPAELFTSEQARWVAVQISGQNEQARFLLVSAPYALKAGDAETLGGLPPSAFALANSAAAAASLRPGAAREASASTNAKASNPPNPPITGAGTVDYIPMWDSTSDIINSVMYQTGLQIGINTTTPAATLDVNGKTDLRDTLTLVCCGHTLGTTHTPLVISGSPFYINGKGIINFGTGQTFPGTAELASPNAFTSNQSINVSTASTTGLVISASGSSSNGVLAYGSNDGGYFLGGSDGVVASGDDDGGSFVGNNNGVVGIASVGDGGGAGVAGSAPIVGVLGTTTEFGEGVQGVGVTNSGTGEFIGSAYYTVGAWGDTGQKGAIGVGGSADDGYAFYGINTSGADATPTMFLQNLGQPGIFPVLVTTNGANNGNCEIDTGGDIGCSGSISGIVPAAGGKKQVALNAVESPDHWFEDFGNAQLSGGEAVVNIESVFGETVNTGVDYHVFLTPNGDCKGLYVAQKSATSFVVRELGGGTSSLVFDYRIAAKRRGYEQVRLADKTAEFARIKRPPQLKPVPAAARHTMPTARQIFQQQMAHAGLPRTSAPLLPNQP
jgi:hypothetical protein